MDKYVTNWLHIFTPVPRTLTVPLLLLTAALYAPILDNWIYADDVDDWLRTLEPASRWDLFDTSALALRPFELLVNALDVTLLGPQITLLSHLAGWAGHLLAVALLYAVARRLRLSPFAALFAAVFFALHPANVLAVSQVDTISQQLGTLFPLALLTAALPSAAHNRPGRRRLAFTIPLLLIATLLSKETTLGFVLVWPFAAALLASGQTSPRQMAALPRRVALSIALLTLYVLFRLAADPVVGDGRYALDLAPTAVLRNAATLLGAAVYPGSTLNLFGPPAIRGGQAAGWGVLLTVALLLGALLGFAVARPAVRRRAAGVALLAAANCLPIVLITRVSELYAYGLTPFVALFFALTLAAAGRAVYRRYPTQKRELRPLALLFTVWLAVAVWGKVAALDQTAVRARQYLDETLSWSARSPELVLCLAENDRSLAAGYSGFFVDDRVLLGNAVVLASHLNNLKIIVTSPADATCDGVAIFDDGVLTITTPTAVLPSSLIDAHLPTWWQTPPRLDPDRSGAFVAQPAAGVHRLAGAAGDGPARLLSPATTRP